LLWSICNHSSDDHQEKPVNGVSLEQESKHFEGVVWPHVRAAYNLARWLVRNDHDAEDVVQDSFTKAFQARSALRNADARAWLLAIVRNTALSFLERRRRTREVAWNENAPEPADCAPDPESGLIVRSRRDRIRRAIERLPEGYREALVLREIEGLAYKEIAYILKVPMGTVMSRLARARNLLVEQLVPETEKSL
jgi:RNA polymerase sigma-70 factor, ECF subfamily